MFRTRTICFDDDGAHEVTDLPAALAGDDLLWIDVEIAEPDPGDGGVLAELGFDPLAVHDAIHDDDLPKLDDFGDHLLLVLHGLHSERIETYEVDCFLTDRMLVTVHDADAPAIEAMWADVEHHPLLVADGCAGLAARLADGLTRRLASVVDAFDARVDELIAQALTADRSLLGDVTAVRADLATVRRVVSPQREALDLVRTTDSVLVDDRARRRFSDVFDVATRAASGLDAARAALAETLEAYRGAEAREATEVTKVLTIYAAIMLPLTLIVGFFGMNHTNLPTLDTQWGWIAVAVVMALVAAISLGVFVVEGWVRRPSGRRAGATIGRGLAEAARAPVQVAGAVYEISTLPLRGARTMLSRESPAGASGRVTGDASGDATDASGRRRPPARRRPDRDA